MAKTEAELRREAVARRLSGESPAEIARSLGRSRQWVAKWVRRHDPTDERWAQGVRPGPKRARNRTPSELEAQVLAVRTRLEANPWAQVGAPAIAWELSKLGQEPPPSRTIERILGRGGVTRRHIPRRREPKGVPYPKLVAKLAGDVHEADLVGPRYLGKGMRFFALNTVDLAPHSAAIEIVPAKSDHDVASALFTLWRRLGVPRRVKFDNGPPFCGVKGLGLVIRLCVHNGVIPVFIPQAEPWRNGVIEHFNDTFDKRFLRSERFRSLGELQRRALAFERFHNANHRYRATSGRTPDECKPRESAAPAHALEQIPPCWPREGKVEFVRFIRSDRKLRLFHRALSLPATAVYEYVTAVLDLGVPPPEGNLLVHRDGELLARHSLPIPAT